MTLSELHNASALLGATIDRYCVAFSTITNNDNPFDPLSSLSQATFDGVTAELELISVYVKRLQQLQVVANRVRNLIPTVAPINVLPPDILVNIFELLIGARPCILHLSEENRAVFLRYPDIITRVCSHWRDIATNSRILWSRVELAASTHMTLSDRSYHTCGKWLINRAKGFETRLGHLPVDVQFSQSVFGVPKAADDLEWLLASVATRTRCLEFIYEYDIRLDASFLGKYLAACAPGALQQLVLTGNLNREPEGFYPSSVFLATERVPGARTSLLDVPQQRLDDVLFPVRVLRLQGVYFHWTSLAYHGLTELRLTRGAGYDRRTAITPSGLGGILGASPGLHTLHFNIPITDLLRDRIPVALDNLEVLNLRGMESSERRVLLQSISTGSRPLRLSVTLFPLVNESAGSLNDELARLFDDVLISFSSRSNVTQMFIEIEGPTNYPPQLLDILSSLPLPSLRTLYLCELNLDQTHSRSNNGAKNPLLVPKLLCSGLEALYFTQCSINLHDLQRATALLPITELKLGASYLGRWVKNNHELISDLGPIRLELDRVFPSINTECNMFSELWGAWQDSDEVDQLRAWKEAVSESES